MRCWTLQEHLAPSSVEFFTKEVIRLGDKKSLAQWIHETTRIPVLALRGAALYEFSAEKKLEWATDRMTTREVDQAYYLFGIFDISMPVIYGEGREKASRRLRKEIDDAPKHMASLFASGGKSFVATSTDSSDFIFFYNVEHNLTMSFRSKGGAFFTRLVQVNGETIRGKEAYANQLAATSHHTNYIDMFYVNNASGILSDLFTHDNGRTFKAGSLDTQGGIPTSTGRLTATSNSQRPGVSIFLIDAVDSRCVTKAIWNNGWSVNRHLTHARSNFISLGNL